MAYISKKEKKGNMCVSPSDLCHIIMNPKSNTKQEKATEKFLNYLPQMSCKNLKG